MANAIKASTEYEFELPEAPLSVHQLDQAKAIGQCLDYLRDEATRVDLHLLAHIIDIAAACAKDISNGNRRSGSEQVHRSNGNGRK